MHENYPTDAPTDVQTDRLASADLDADAAARGGLYGALALAFRSPTEETYDLLADGSLESFLTALLDRTSLDVAPPDLAATDDFDTLSARYNDLFVVGFARYTDRSDGSLSASSAPVPLYESAYRPDVSWNDVNVDLARAYDYFGVSVDQDRRDHHDYLPLELEFAGYLARLEAADEDDSTAAARLDLLDRHLRVLTEGVADAIADEPGVGRYGDLVDLLARFVAADRADLVDRTEGT